MLEQVTTNGGSSLNGNITNSAATLVVTSAASFPTIPQFRIIVDSEIMIVTGVAGTTFTVTRAQEGTSAASHTSGAAVTEWFTAGAVLKLRSDILPVPAAYSTLPAPSVSLQGMLFLPSDGNCLLQFNGSSWQAFGPLMPIAPPVGLSTFGFINKGSASMTAQGSGFTFNAPATGGSDHLIACVHAVTPPYTMTAAFLPMFGVPGFGGCGLTLTDGTKFADFTINWRTAGAVFGSSTAGQGFHYQLDKYSTTATFASSYFQFNSPAFGNLVWMRIQDDGTSRYYSYSNDGVNWVLLEKVANTDFLTSSSIGFILNTNSTDTLGQFGMNILSYTD